MYKLNKTNNALLSGRVRSKEIDKTIKDHISELQSEVDQLLRDRADTEMATKDSTENHRAQLKAMEDLHLVELNKFKKQNKLLVDQMFEQQEDVHILFTILSFNCYFNSNLCLSLLEL